MARGGARPGAGRRPKPAKVLRKVVAEEILAAVDERKLWLRLLDHKDARLAFEALRYLTDRRDGRPAQSVMHAGADGGPLEVIVRKIGGAE